MDEKPTTPVVLAAYATVHGSTRGVAERIAGRLRRRGIALDVRAMSDARDLDRYQAIVLGSAIHSGKWLPAASRFVDRNATRLRRCPVWLFSVSTLGDAESMYRPRVATWLRALRRDTPQMGGFRTAIGPREHRNFAGAIARSDWPVSGRVVFRLMGGRYGDHRDWAAIDAWADHIADEMLSSAPAAGRRPPEWSG